VCKKNEFNRTASFLLFSLSLLRVASTKRPRDHRTPLRFVPFQKCSRITSHPPRAATDERRFQPDLAEILAEFKKKKNVRYKLLFLFETETASNFDSCCSKGARSTAQRTGAHLEQQQRDDEPPLASRRRR